MSNNQLVPVKRAPLALQRKAPVSTPAPLVMYGLIDPLHYSFTYEYDETIFIRMDESEHAGKRNDFSEAVFEDSVPENHRAYYLIAAASGALTGALSFVKLSEEQLAKIEEWKEKDWHRIVIYAAELIGCKKKDYKSASKYLVDQAVKRLKEDETAKEYMAILASHPTLAGLVFSLITQFAGKNFSLSESGKINTKTLPKYYYVGDTNAEKIMAAILYWLFNLAANQASSKRYILDDLGIPVELLKKLKTFVNIPFLKRIPDDYAQAEKEFSDWIRSILDGIKVVDEDGNAEANNLIKNLMRIALDLSQDAFPVLINECVIRCLYILMRLCEVATTNQVKTFDELKAMPATEVLPQDGRVLSGMCLVASVSFVGTNLSVAALKALASSKAGDRKFLEAFLTEINIAGIGRLIFACAADSKFWGDDIKLQFQRKPRSHAAPDGSYEHIEEEEAFSTLSLDAIQARILYCFENIAVLKDIERTEKEDEAAKKRLWLEAWRSNIIAGVKLAPEFEAQYFVDDEDMLFDGLYELAKDKTNFGWFYLLVQEFALFEPYFPLGCEKDSDFKKLKLRYDYVSDQFIRRQTIASQSEVDQILKTYKKYTNHVSGKTTKTITTVITGTAATAVTGGLALAFAPGIAVLIAGEAVVGLHGAALTGASLAFVGGGSLAAGGLGMAGGTAIITGGGALLGLAGSGGISAAAMLMSTSSEYWVRQCAKLLTYSKCTLHDTLEDKSALTGLSHQIEYILNNTSEEYSALKKEKNDLDKDYLKNLGRICGYLEKVHTELQKLEK